MKMSREEHASFWSDVDAELARVPSDVEVTTDARPSLEGINVSRVAFSSLGGIRIAAWLCTPAVDGPHPGLLIPPGYKSEPLPEFGWAKRGFATLSVAHRGKLGAMEDFNPGIPGMLIEGIDDPTTYAYRGVYADCIRALEILGELPDVTDGPHAISGFSQGGPLGIAAAARRPDLVRALAIGAPFLTAVPYSVAATRSYPYRELAELLMNNPQRRDEIFGTLAHFDTLSFASALTMPAFVYRGDSDESSPPMSAAMLYDEIPEPKEWREYANTSHGKIAPQQADIAAFLSEGITLTPPTPAPAAPPRTFDTDESATGAQEAPFERVAAHIGRARLSRVDLSQRHPADATLEWISYDTPDGATAGAYLSVPTRAAAVTNGLIVEFPRYDSAVKLAHAEDRERYPILKLVHRGQRGRGFAPPGDQPGVLTDPGVREPWMLERIVADCLLGLELVARDFPEPLGPVIGIGPDWSLAVAAHSAILTHLEVDEYWVEGFDPNVHESSYPRREFTEVVATEPADVTASLLRSLERLSPTNHAQNSTVDLLLVAGKDSRAAAFAASIANAHGGPVEQHSPLDGKATEADWRETRRSELLGVGTAQRWRQARAGVGAF